MLNLPNLFSLKRLPLLKQFHIVLFYVLVFHVLHFHVLLFGPSFSPSAISWTAHWSNFMSCYFMPCKLVRQFHVRHFHVQHFQRLRTYIVVTQRLQSYLIGMSRQRRYRGPLAYLQSASLSHSSATLRSVQYGAHLCLHDPVRYLGLLFTHFYAFMHKQNNKWKPTCNVQTHCTWTFTDYFVLCIANYHRWPASMGMTA